MNVYGATAPESIFVKTSLILYNFNKVLQTWENLFFLLYIFFFLERDHLYLKLKIILIKILFFVLIIGPYSTGTYSRFFFLSSVHDTSLLESISL